MIFAIATLLTLSRLCFVYILRVCVMPNVRIFVLFFFLLLIVRFRYIYIFFIVLFIAVYLQL